MAPELFTDFGGVIAQRIKDAHRVIAQRWLDRLQALLPVDRNEIFPTDQLLDHIPALIQEIAEYVGREPGDALIANTTVFSKARELGELRFEQKASVHQLLREYRILDAVLGAFVLEQFDAMAVASTSSEAIGVANRLHEAAFVLLQTTVDTFVGRYTEMIGEQTARLESFNRMVSHELRQPLSSTQNAVELLRTPAAGDPANRDRFLDIAERGIRRMAQMLRMLGALVRPEPDNPQTQDTDLAKLIDDVLRQLGEMAQARGVLLESHVAPLTLTLDVARLELLLLNLISNGIKYRDPAKLRAFVSVTVAPEAAGCLLRVRDNGLGIPEADRANVFRRFHRAHASRDRELGNDGAGLGLVIVAECVRALNGTIRFESIEGTGTTFVVQLPAAPA
jgi:signal transduction histidine kinase